MLFFFMILCIIVLLPWTDSSSPNEFQTDSGKAASHHTAKAIPGLSVEQGNNLLANIPYEKPQNDETIPKLKVIYFLFTVP